jgi:serine/threonine-protein kinase
MVYIAGQSDTAKRTVVWVDRQGHEEPLNVPVRAYAYATLSPDGTRVALDVREASNDIWIWDLQRQTLTRLTFDPGFNRGPSGRLMGGTWRSPRLAMESRMCTGRHPTARRQRSL